MGAARVGRDGEAEAAIRTSGARVRRLAPQAGQARPSHRAGALPKERAAAASTCARRCDAAERSLECRELHRQGFAPRASLPGLRREPSNAGTGLSGLRPRPHHPGRHELPHCGAILMGSAKRCSNCGDRWLSSRKHRWYEDDF